MGTISSLKKMGIAVAGAALTLGMVGLPSAFADEPATGTISVSPEAGWVAANDATASLVISGTGCTGDNEFGYAVSIQVGEGGWQADTLDPETGAWSDTLIGPDGTALSNYLSSTTHGGLVTLSAACWALSDPADLDAQPVGVIAYDPITVAVVGRASVSGTVGEDVQVEADGFLPGETVTFTVSDGVATGSTPGLVGTGVADENGHVSTTINVPESTVEDSYTFTVLGQTSGRSIVTTGLTVGNPPTEETPATTVMFPTGGAAVPGHSLALLGFGLIVLMGAIATLAIGRKAYQR